MPYVVGLLTGDVNAENALEDVARYFDSALAKLRRREAQWVLESSSFEGCKSSDEMNAGQIGSCRE